MAGNPTHGEKLRQLLRVGVMAVGAAAFVTRAAPAPPQRTDAWTQTASGALVEANRGGHQAPVPSGPHGSAAQGDAVDSLAGEDPPWAVGRLDGSADSHAEATALDPEGWQAFYSRGEATFRLRRFRQALDDFGMVVALQPHFPGAYFARGMLRWLGGQCTGARADFQAFAALANDHVAVSRGIRYMEDLQAAARCGPAREVSMPT